MPLPMLDPTLLTTVALLLALRPADEKPAAAPTTASAAETDTFLAAWGKKAEEIRSLTITFRQEKRLKILRRPRVSEGDLVFADGKLAVVVRGKDGEVESSLLLKDGVLKVFYPRLQTLEVIAVGKGGGAPGLGGGFTPFAARPQDLRQDYDVTLERAPEKDVIILIPRDPKSPVKRLEMTLVNFEVRAYRQVEAAGDEMRMEVLSAKVNAEVPASRFELEVPPDVKVVRPDGSRPAGGQ